MDDLKVIISVRRVFYSCKGSFNFFFIDQLTIATGIVIGVVAILISDRSCEVAG